MDRIYFETYRGQRIFRIDYSGMSDRAESLRMLEELRTTVPQHPLDSLLVLSDVSGARYGPEVIQALKETVRATRPHERAGAVIGLSAMQRMILRAVRTFSGHTALREFSSEQEAKDWLVSRAAAAPEPREGAA